jgi:hypothetical protein
VAALGPRSSGTTVTARNRPVTEGRSGESGSTNRMGSSRTTLTPGRSMQPSSLTISAASSPWATMAWVSSIVPLTLANMLLDPGSITRGGMAPTIGRARLMSAHLLPVRK